MMILENIFGVFFIFMVSCLPLFFGRDYDLELAAFNAEEEDD